MNSEALRRQLTLLAVAILLLAVGFLAVRQYVAGAKMVEGNLAIKRMAWVSHPQAFARPRTTAPSGGVRGKLNMAWDASGNPIDLATISATDLETLETWGADMVHASWPSPHEFLVIEFEPLLDRGYQGMLRLDVWLRNSSMNFEFGGLITGIGLAAGNPAARPAYTIVEIEPGSPLPKYVDLDYTIRISNKTIFHPIAARGKIRHVPLPAPPATLGASAAGAKSAPSQGIEAETSSGTLAR